MNIDLQGSKEMIYYVDIDGVLCENTYGQYDQASPVEENIAKVNALFDQGHTVILWTARGATTGIDWRSTTEKQMKRWGVKHHELRMGKPAYDVFIDDKAMRIEELP